MCYQWLRRWLYVFVLSGVTLGAQAASYTFDDTVPYAWETASTNVIWDQVNTAYPIDDDKQLVNIGFAFSFGGVNYTQVRILANGALHFGADQGFHKDYTNEALPITTAVNGPGPESPADRVIAPYWDDLEPSSGGTVRYSQLGTSPNRRFVVSWENVPHYPGTGSYTFQVILYENGEFKFQYGGGNTRGSSATIGVEVDNTDFTQYSYNRNSVRNGDAILFSPTPPAAVLGEWHLDEGTWGVVGDSSGNGNDGSAIGGAVPQNASPVVSGDPGTCGYADIPRNTSAAVFDAIDTGVDVDDQVGNSGTIDFWYKSNARWNGNSGDRQLLDASTAAPSNKYFSLTLRNNSRLRFGLEDSADGDYRLDTGNNNFNAGVWVHIAVTWDLPNDRLQIYINGNLAASRTFATNGVLGEMDTLYLGDNRSSYIVGGMTGNSANGSIDEARVYRSVLSSTEIQADMNATHPCGSVLDHFVIGHDGYGINCLAEPVSVTAAAADNSTVTTYVGTITLDTQTGTGNWRLNSGNGIFSDAVAGDGLATYQFAAADAGVASFDLDYQTGPATVNIRVTDGAVSDDDTEGNLLFSPSGFIVTPVALSNPPPGTIDQTILSQVAASSFPLYIAAYGQTPTDPVCGIIEAYDGTKNINFWSSYNNPATGSLQVSVDTTPVATSEAVSAPQTLVFTQGQAAITVNYPDVGDIDIALKDDTTGNPSLPTGIRGASQPFVVRPAAFVLSNIVRSSDGFANPAAGDENGGIFIAAGRPFSVTATAVNSLGNATPNYGQEVNPESVFLTPNLIAAGGVNNPALNYTTGFGAFSAGSATGTDFSWGEVGIISLVPSIGDGDYLGAGDVTGTPSGNVGRFTPVDFNVTLDNAPAFATACGSFGYMGQAFSYATAPQVTIAARNSAGGITQNYDNNWWKLADFSESYAHNGGLPASVTLDASGAGHAAIACGNCAGTVTTSFNGSLSYTTSTLDTLPFNGAVDISFPVTDSDGISYAANPFTISAIGFDAGSEQRSGRGFAQDVYGTYAAIGDVLIMPVGTQYYSSASTWVDNSADSCTTYSYAKSDGGITTSSTPTSPVSVASGDGSLNIQLTGDSGDPGGVSTFNFTWPSWLSGTASATATFGIFRGDDRFLYWREAP